MVPILSSLSGLILPIDVVNDRGISKSPENVLAHSKCSKHSGDAFGHLQVVKIKSWAQRNLALPGTEEHTDGSAESHAIHRFLHWLLILKAPSIGASQHSFPPI